MNRQQLINVTDVLRHAFQYQDPRLINHGERVAYILLNMLKDNPDYSILEKQNIFMLGLLHDIGAYKEEEIDSMLSFDMQDSLEHSEFGYLLFKTFSPLPEYADCILYHHNHTAQYYPVPIFQKHREIAKLIYLADRIDIFVVLNGTDSIESFFKEPTMRAAFSDEDLSLFLECDKKYHILENMKSKDYLTQISEYTSHELVLSEAQMHDYLMTYIFSLDFRNEYTALHTSYAIQLSEKFAKALHLTTTSCKMIRLATILHNIGKTSIPLQVHSAPDFERYVKELYTPSLAGITRNILTGAADEQIILTIEQSFHLLECFFENKRITFAPSPAAEIVALSYFISNNMNSISGTNRLTKEQLIQYLTEKYKTCGLEDSILTALIKNYDDVLTETKLAANSVKNTYLQMMDEEHALHMILLHYNKKYSE